MFAYCKNNPVKGFDPSGTRFQDPNCRSCGRLLEHTDTATGTPIKPREDLANANDLDINTAASSSYNCYGNGIGMQIAADPTGYVHGQDAETVFKEVQGDLGGYANCRRLVSFDTPAHDGWFRVALMCAPTDYHFIRETEDGWYNKSGADPFVGGCFIPEEYVNSNIWYPYGVVNGVTYIFNRPQDPVYVSDNGPVFFEIRIGWDN